MPYCFLGSSIKYQGHTGWKIDRFKSSLSKITRPVAAIKSLRFALFKVIHEILRSHKTKNHQFWPELSFSGLQLQFEFTDGFEMMHNVWHSIEVVPYCFFRSSIEFQGHTGRKINNLNPVTVRLLGRSLLSNPSDLPCSSAIIWELRSWTYTWLWALTP